MLRFNQEFRDMYLEGPYVIINGLASSELEIWTTLTVNSLEANLEDRWTYGN